MSLYAMKHENCPSCRCTEPIGESSARPDGSTQDATIDRLRGQLQNCVDHLSHANRKAPWLELDGVIDGANRVLYETLMR